jgi:hypothetical protein
MLLLVDARRGQVAYCASKNKSGARGTRKNKQQQIMALAALSGVGKTADAQYQFRYQKKRKAAKPGGSAGVNVSGVNMA